MVSLRRRILWVVLAAMGVSTPAVAGSVVVHTSDASGDMGTAHNGIGSIGCWVSTDTIGPPLLYCSADDGAGHSAYCFTTNWNMVSTAPGITTVGEIDFGWDGSHNCSWLVVSNFSQPPGRKHP